MSERTVPSTSSSWDRLAVVAALAIVGAVAALGSVRAMVHAADLGRVPLERAMRVHHADEGRRNPLHSMTSPSSLHRNVSSCTTYGVGQSSQEGNHVGLLPSSETECPRR